MDKEYLDLALKALIKSKSILKKKKPKKINFDNFQKVIMTGCASLSLLKCVLGKHDWYNEKNIMIWDIIVGVHFNLINKCKIKKFKINKICQEVSLGYCY